MPALNFQERFAPAVQQRMKRTTIRRPRKDIYIGCPLYLYTGMRTKACRPLGDSYCSGITPVYIYEDGQFLLGDHLLEHNTQLNLLADVDTAGLLDATQFIEFFRSQYGLPFIGILISWL